ncbi:uncharacterized protein Tco025E_02561 [Trypanosoma conorhini]|uniref:Uncharacterized protein n=1 Tax=Trypanosoma conorhini TaxID=83891 RepID=A0A422Q2W8_9TRYP|nr:uncharacterized protein Tco025E_02561 [Trypanosoma conorhini]RNF24310.1 hypothetical protein Tco025E_02561 [Trypanosoma conorhini]
MKNTDHLKSLIGDLEAYERELKEKVLQKEVELQQLLQRLGPATATVTAGCCSSAALSGPWRLCVARAEAAGRAVTGAAAASPSPCITDERRRIPLTLSGRGSLGNGHAEKHDAPQKKDTSASIDIDALSSISRASTSSVESADALSKARQLLAAIDTAKGRPARRVRFASRSPQVVSSALQGSAPAGPAKGAAQGKPRGTPLPQSQAPQALPREDGGASSNAVAVPMRDNSASPLSQAAPGAGIRADSPDRVLADDDGPCYVRRRQQQQEEERRRKAQRGRPQSSNSDETFAVGNISTAVELTRVASPSDSDLPCALRRYRSDSSQRQQVCLGPPEKRRQNSASPSLSAARPHPVSEAQVEGRGAGIVLACGPTLFFD